MGGSADNFDKMGLDNLNRFDFDTKTLVLYS